MKFEIVSKTESAPIFLGQDRSAVNQALGESPKKSPGFTDFPNSFQCYYPDHDLTVLFNSDGEAMLFDFYPSPESDREIVVGGVTIDYSTENLIELERRGHRLAVEGDTYRVTDLNVNIRINDEIEECGVAYSTDEADAPFLEFLDYQPVSLL